MERSILFFDIDGTILTETEPKIIPDSTRKALALARKQGHLVFINTGRVNLNIEDKIREVGFDGYVCGCGTQIIYQGKELFHHKIPDELCRETLEIVKKSRMNVLFEADDMNGIITSEDENIYFQNLIDYFNSDGRKLVDPDSEEFHFDKFTGWYRLEDTKLHEDYVRFVEEHYDYIDRGQEGGYGMCEIVPKGYSKGTGIQYLLDYFQIPWENSYSFGDSTNDIPMFGAAGHAIAMGGSAKVVQEAVEYVAPPILEDGLYQAMKEYRLI